MFAKETKCIDSNPEPVYAPLLKLSKRRNREEVEMSLSQSDVTGTLKLNEHY